MCKVRACVLKPLVPNATATCMLSWSESIIGDSDEISSSSLRIQPPKMCVSRTQWVLYTRDCVLTNTEYERHAHIRKVRETRSHMHGPSTLAHTYLSLKVLWLHNRNKVTSFQYLTAYWKITKDLCETFKKICMDTTTCSGSVWKTPLVSSGSVTGILPISTNVCGDVFCFS